MKEIVCRESKFPTWDQVWIKWCILMQLSYIFETFTIWQHDAVTILKILYTSQIEATIYPPLGKPSFSSSMT